MECAEDVCTRFLTRGRRVSVRVAVGEERLGGGSCSESEGGTREGRREGGRESLIHYMSIYILYTMYSRYTMIISVRPSRTYCNNVNTGRNQ